jgi:glyoxylase-like metal-dependent hydrolase (beta-lactamase superfamily II)
MEMDKEIAEGLFQFEREKTDKILYAYFWKKPSGNILFNHIPDPSFWTPRLKALEKAGGIRWLYLTHSGDAGKGMEPLHKAFGMETVASATGGEKVRKLHKVPLGKILLHETRSIDGIKCIFAPGHADLFYVFKFKAGAKTCLFTSDMFMQASPGTWKVKIPERLKEKGMETLGAIFDERFDLLLPGLSGSGAGGPYEAGAKDRKEWREKLQTALAKKYRMAHG